MNRRNFIFAYPSLAIFASSLKEFFINSGSLPNETPAKMTGSSDPSLIVATGPQVAMKYTVEFVSDSEKNLEYLNSRFSDSNTVLFFQQIRDKQIVKHQRTIEQNKITYDIVFKNKESMDYFNSQIVGPQNFPHDVNIVKASSKIISAC